ncbi:MAG TPA: exosortase W [bacterium]
MSDDLRRAKVAALAVVAAYLATVAPVLVGLVHTWLSQDEYAHGFLIPLISGYLVYSQRERLRSIGIRPMPVVGLAALVVGCLVFLLGQRGGIVTVERISVILMLMASILLLLGYEFFRALLLPLLYLFFMIPILDLSANAIHWPFQLVTATIAAKALALFGVPVLQSQQYLHLPSITLEVANLCSGARFFISIVAIGIPLAYFTQRTFLRRAALLGFAILISIVTNGVRVTLIGVWAYYFNTTADIHGPAHVLQGLFVSVVGYVVLFAVAIAYSESRPREAGSAKAGFSAKPTNGRINEVVRASAAALVALGFVFVYAYVVPLRDVAEPNAGNRLSPSFGTWDIRSAESSQMLPGADHELNVTYRSEDGRSVGVYRGYFASQRQGKECIESGSKWGAQRGELLRLRLPEGGTAEVNAATYIDGSQEYLALYWYELDGRTFARRGEVKLRTALNGVLRNRNNGAVVVVYRHIDNAGERAPATAELSDFVSRSGLLRARAGETS